MKIKRGTIKDWIEVIILVAIVICITFYLCSWYKNYKNESMNTFILDDLVKQIRYEELDPYLQENNDVYVYFCVIDDYNCREFETEIKETIQKQNLQDYIVYVNLTDEENKKEVIANINKKYGNSKKIDNYPALVRIKDAKIVSMMDKTNNKLTKNNFEKYMDLNEID